MLEYSMYSLWRISSSCTPPKRVLIRPLICDLEMFQTKEPAFSSSFVTQTHIFMGLSVVGKSQVENSKSYQIVAQQFPI